jgi:hypothetical protein
MAAKIRYSKMVKTCKNMFHMIAQHESWNHDIFGRVPRDYVRFHFLGFCISWPDLNLSSSQLISAHLSSKYHEFQWNLEFWCGHVQMDHHGSEDICLKRFRVTFGWNQPEFLCFCAIEIDRSAEEPSKFTDFWIYADTQKNTINDLPWSTPFGILVEAQPALSHHRFIRRDMLWWIVITSWAWSMVWCLADDIGNRSSEGLFLPQFAEGQG